MVLPGQSAETDSESLINECVIVFIFVGMQPYDSNNP